MMRRQNSGFTLVEVLVAMSITALALMAGIKATGGLMRNAEHQTLSLLGQICAENELVRLRLYRQLPNLGNTETECLQAGHLLLVRLSVQQTPNPWFRRVDVNVQVPKGPVVRQLTAVMGQLR